MFCVFYGTDCLMEHNEMRPVYHIRCTPVRMSLQHSRSNIEFVSFISHAKANTGTCIKDIHVHLSNFIKDNAIESV